LAARRRFGGRFFGKTTSLGRIGGNDNQAIEAMSYPAAVDCWFLSGPTASGKTAVSLELAQRIGGEIISLDSMAVYRGMDIGTAKPSIDDRRAAPHHLIDVVDPHETFSVAQYVAAAHEAIASIRARGREALFVGGSPLYLKAMLRGLFQGPAADWSFRKQLNARIEREGAAVLHAELAKVDPIAAERLHPNDGRRITRALEVFHVAGEPISRLQREFDRARPAEACRAFYLDWPRETLHERIDARVEKMFAAGLVDEVRDMHSAGNALSRTAAQGVGYRETIDHLHGKIDLAEAIRLVKLHTRQMAKRQMTWFRSLSECRPIAVAPSDSPDAIAERITSSR
jgi:tRNA dimethylallyltransferase